MSAFSDFRQRLKVDIQEKTAKEKKYKSSEIVLREDNQTGKIGIYIVKKTVLENLKIQKKKGWSSRRSKMKNINLEDSKNVIYYEQVVSPCGHLGHKEYWDWEDEQRYGKIYFLSTILQQLDGENAWDIYNKTYTKNELIELVERLNQEKENAKFQYLYKIKYADGFAGKKLLDGKHIALTFEKHENGREVKKWVCVENEEILVKFDKNYNLVTTTNGKRERVSPINYSWKEVDLPNVHSPNSNSLRGFTIKALSKIAEDQEKERRGEREDE